MTENEVPNIVWKVFYQHNSITTTIPNVNLLGKQLFSGI